MGRGTAGDGVPSGRRSGRMSVRSASSHRSRLLDQAPGDSRLQVVGGVGLRARPATAVSDVGNAKRE